MFIFSVYLIKLRFFMSYCVFDQVYDPFVIYFSYVHPVMFDARHISIYFFGVFDRNKIFHVMSCLIRCTNLF